MELAGVWHATLRDIRLTPRPSGWHHNHSERSQVRWQYMRLRGSALVSRYCILHPHQVEWFKLLRKTEQIRGREAWPGV